MCLNDTVHSAKGVKICLCIIKHEMGQNVCIKTVVASDDSLHDHILYTDYTPDIKDTV